MAAETGFLIDGTVYEVPTLDSLTMGERRVLYDLSGVTQEDFVRGEDELEDEHDERVGKMMRHPGFMEALMHVAYQRGNPGVKAAKVSLVIDQTNFLDAVATMGADEPEDDPVPLVSTKSPDEPSTGKNGLSSEPSGAASPNDSDGLVAVPTHIGITRSGTSSPASPQPESVA